MVVGEEIPSWRIRGKKVDHGQRLQQRMDNQEEEGNKRKTCTPPLFSVVVISFNQEDLICQTLDSILSQTYPNIELIISDDNSTDGTLQKIEHWVKENKARFDSVTIVSSKENSGISGNLNRGIEKASGEYIREIAGDDLMPADALAKMAEFFSENPEANVGLGSHVPFVVQEGKILFLRVTPKKKYRKLQKKNCREQFSFLATSSKIAGGDLFFRKGFFEKHGFFFPENRNCEDWPFILRFLLQGERIFFMEEDVLFYRRHSRSISASAFREENTRVFEEQIQVLQNWVLPNVELLSTRDRLAAHSKYEYLKTLVKNGCGVKAHKIARRHNLQNPYWWIETLPLWFYHKITNSLVNSKIRHSD